LIGLLDLSGAGNDGANKLVGNSGDNELDGREGADTLTGGDGDDGFVIGDVRSGLDVITDFGRGDDVIFLDALDLGLFNPDTLTGYNGVVKETDFEAVSRKGLESDDAMFVFDQSTHLLSMVDGSGYLDLVQVEGPGSEDLVSSDLYVLL
jgi:Ca2+-binding RTX toxin-like protein